VLPYGVIKNDDDDDTYHIWFGHDIVSHFHQGPFTIRNKNNFFVNGELNYYITRCDTKNPGP